MIQVARTISRRRAPTPLKIIRSISNHEHGLHFLNTCLALGRALPLIQRCKRWSFVRSRSLSTAVAEREPTCSSPVCACAEAARLRLRGTSEHAASHETNRTETLEVIRLQRPLPPALSAAHATSTGMSFHRRILACPPAVSFNSTEGKQLFIEALGEPYMETYFPLVSFFHANMAEHVSSDENVHIGHSELDDPQLSSRLPFASHACNLRFNFPLRNNSPNNF